MFQKEINFLREELQTSEEQERSLVKIKDMLRDEMKKQSKVHESQMERMEEEIERLRGRMDESFYNHNMEALTQLFAKMVGIFRLFEDGQLRASTREEKRQEFDEYIKMVCNLLEL